MTMQEKSGKKLLGWEDCPGVTRDPRRVHGAWTFGNTRMPLYVIFRNLAGGATIQEVTQQFSVTEEQIKTVLDHVAQMLEEDLIIEQTQR